MVESKFWAMNRIKQELLKVEEIQIKYSEKIISNIERSSRNIIFLILKSKRKEILSFVLERMKLYSMEIYYRRRNSHRVGMRKILKILLKNKRAAFDLMYVSRASIDKRIKLISMVKIIIFNRKDKISWGIWKLRKNLLEKRREQVENDIRIFENKINNTSDSKIQAVKERKGKLEEHISKIQRQTTSMESELMS
jgi:hypothetical protein